MKKHKFSVIVCGRNEEKNISNCLSSCINQNYDKSKFEIIYVDNGSSDRSLELAKQFTTKTFIEKRVGLSESRNLGIKKSDGEILIFLDADAVLDRDYLKNHEKTFSNKNVGAGGGKVLPLIPNWISNYLGISLFESYPRFNDARLVRTYPGCNLSIRQSVLDEIGFFTEALKSSAAVTRFAEDKEICERIRSARYQIAYNPKAVIFHDNPHSLKKLIKVWFYGASGRANMIRIGKQDHFTVLFRFNFPIILVFTTVLLTLIDLRLGLLLLLVLLIGQFFLCIKSYLETKLFFSSFFIKPWMDLFSLVLINVGVLYFMNSNK